MNVCWAVSFERLYQADPPAVKLDVKGVTIPMSDPQINHDPPSFVETQAVMNQVKGRKALEICSIYAEVLKAGENAVLRVITCSSVLCLEHRDQPD